MPQGSARPCPRRRFVSPPSDPARRPRRASATPRSCPPARTKKPRELGGSIPGFSQKHMREGRRQKESCLVSSFPAPTRGQCPRSRSPRIPGNTHASSYLIIQYGRCRVRVPRADFNPSECRQTTHLPPASRTPGPPDRLPSPPDARGRARRAGAENPREPRGPRGRPLNKVERGGGRWKLARSSCDAIVTKPSASTVARVTGPVYQKPRPSQPRDLSADFRSEL